MFVALKCTLYATSLYLERLWKGFTCCFNKRKRERERELRRNLSNSVASFLLSTLHVNVNHFFGNFSKKNSHNLLLLFILLLLFVRFKHYAIICRILNYSQHTLNTQHPFPFLLLLFTINLHLIILLFLTYL